MPRSGKFYEEQVAHIQKLLVRFVEEREHNDPYLEICEQMGVEPDPEKMPISPYIFPLEVQNALVLFSYMCDRWEGMSGTYMGKDWSLWPYLIKEYEVKNPKEVFYFAKLFEGLVMDMRQKQASQKRELAERRARGGSKDKT